MATDVAAVEQKIVDNIVNKLLPEVCRDHVYRSEVQRSMQMVDNGEYVYVSWTFFNDQRVRLKARVHRDDEFVYLGIRLEPECDDFEEWQADAIMRCEAGEDVWERPKKPQITQDMFNEMLNQRQQSIYQQAQSGQYGVARGPSFTQEAGGLFSRLSGLVGKK